jgi:DNA-binding MarR family transcriptional regulator
VKKPTVSAMLASLREKGWIADAADPADGRAIAVSLTKAGRARMAGFEAELARSIAKIAPGVDLARLHEALAELHAGMAASQDERLKEIEQKILA